MPGVAELVSEGREVRAEGWGGIGEVRPLRAMVRTFPSLRGKWEPPEVTFLLRCDLDTVTFTCCQYRLQWLLVRLRSRAVRVSAQSGLRTRAPAFAVTLCP